MKKPPVPVTDHALIRHMERAMGLDVERLRRELGHDLARVWVEGANAVHMGGVRYHIEDGQVVTCWPSHEPDRRTGRQRRCREDRT